MSPDCRASDRASQKGSGVLLLLLLLGFWLAAVVVVVIVVLVVAGLALFDNVAQRRRKEFSHFFAEAVLWQGVLWRCSCAL